MAATVGLAVIFVSIGLASLMNTLHIPAGWASTACSWLIVAGYLWQFTVLILCRIEFRDHRFGRVPPRPLTIAIGLALLPFLALCVVCIVLVMSNGALLF